MRLLVVTLVLFTVVAGRAWAGFDEGKAAFERGDWPAALAQWQPCAGAGDAACQNGLGALYRLGRGVPQDLSAAAAWFRKAADQELRQGPGQSRQHVCRGRRTATG